VGGEGEQKANWHHQSEQRPPLARMFNLIKRKRLYTARKNAYLLFGVHRKCSGAILDQAVSKKIDQQ
jgi:hypothetical protein